MKKCDLKDGMVIENRKMDRNIIFKNYLLDSWIEIVNNLNDYDDNLMKKNRLFKDLDIIKVYPDVTILIDDNAEPIWERGVKPLITIQSLSNEYNGCCASIDECGTNCKYYMDDENDEYSCKWSWLLDNYDLKKKDNLKIY